MWKPLRFRAEELEEAGRQLAQKARFLVDEDVDDGLAAALLDMGWNAVGVRGAGLKGRSDEDILAFAHRENRVLVTHDRDYLDDRRFPPHRNPGLIILPRGSPHHGSLINALAAVLPVVGHFRDVFRGSKVEVDGGGVLTILSRDGDTGKMTKTRYRYGRQGVPEAWDEEAASTSVRAPSVSSAPQS
jgi:predicted nuclease of predicted toxin-antitoxin system